MKVIYYENIMLELDRAIQNAEENNMDIKEFLLTPYEHDRLVDQWNWIHAGDQPPISSIRNYKGFDIRVCNLPSPQDLLLEGK